MAIVTNESYVSLQDSHTARFLFDRLLRGPLLAHRTVVRISESSRFDLVSLLPIYLDFGDSPRRIGPTRDILSRTHA